MIFLVLILLSMLRFCPSGKYLNVCVYCMSTSASIFKMYLSRNAVKSTYKYQVLKYKYV